MLRCIRCGACMNHCVVYRQIGGHAYGGVYPGPMGAVLTPVLAGLDKARDLPHACTMNGRCEEVCPVEHPAADPAPRLARPQLARRAGAAAMRARTRALGLRGAAAAPVPAGDAVGVRRCARCSAAAAGSAACRSPGPGRRIATSRAPAGRTFMELYRRVAATGQRGR